MTRDVDDLPFFMEWRELTSLVGTIRTRSLVARPTTLDQCRTALRYARRRRLGPYRPDGERAERRARDLAALDRQGFGYAVACRVIDAEDLDELEQEAEAGPT